LNHLCQISIINTAFASDITNGLDAGSTYKIILIVMIVLFHVCINECNIYISTNTAFASDITNGLDAELVNSVACVEDGLNIQNNSYSYDCFVPCLYK